MPLIKRPFKATWKYITDVALDPDLAVDGKTLMDYTQGPITFKNNFTINKNGFAHFEIEKNQPIGSNGLKFIPNVSESLRIREEINSTAVLTNRENIKTSTLIPIGLSSISATSFNPSYISSSNNLIYSYGNLSEMDRELIKEGENFDLSSTYTAGAYELSYEKNDIKSFSSGYKNNSIELKRDYIKNLKKFTYDGVGNIIEQNVYNTNLELILDSKIPDKFRLIQIQDQARLVSSPSNRFIPLAEHDILQLSTLFSDRYNVYQYDDSGSLKTNTSNKIIIGNAFTFTQEQLETTQPLQNKSVISGLDILDPISGESIFVPGGLKDFRKAIKNEIKNIPVADTASSTILPGEFVDYSKWNIERRVNLGDPGSKNGKNISDYDTGGGGLGAASPTSYDTINAGEVNNQIVKNNDLVHFTIGVLDGDTLQFRAYLNSISDDYSATWDPVKYIGRGENFYTYTGFDRRVSLSWTVVATSKREMLPMYRRLNYLASICAPNYLGQGFMKGNIAQLRVGDYINNTYGLITKVAFEIAEETTWDISIDSDGVPGGGGTIGELPHMIKVTSFEFIPIQNFAPRLGGKFISANFGQNGSVTNSNPTPTSTSNSGGGGTNRRNQRPSF